MLQSKFAQKSTSFSLLHTLYTFAFCLFTLTSNAQVTVTKSELNNITSKQVDQPFTYVINYSTPNTSTAYTNLRICDQLPQGLVFLGVSAATGDMQSLSYNSGTNSVCAVFNSPWNGGAGQFQIVVKFASTVFNGTVASNTATVSSDQYNGTSNTVNITAISSNTPPTLVSGVKITKGIYDPTIFNNGLMMYSLDYGIGGLNPVSGFSIVDPFPSGFIPTQLQGGKSPGTNLSLNVYYKTNINSSYTLLPGSPFNSNTGIYSDINFLPANVRITEIKVEYPALPAGALFTQENNSNLDIRGYYNNSIPNRANNTTFQNCATVTATGTGAGTTTSCINSTYLAGSRLDVGVGKFKPDYSNDVEAGGTYRYYIGVGDGYSNTADIINPVIADLLPPEFIYVGNPTVTGDVYTAAGSPAPVFTVTPNFNGTGRTLVKWAWGPSNPFTIVRSGAAKSFNVSFDIQVRSVPTGVYQNDGFVSVQGTPNKWSSYNYAPIPMTDTLDFDGDGNSTETIAHTYVPVNVINPSGAALVSEKWVKGSLDAGYSRYPASGRTTPGGMADYRLKLKNAGTVALKNIKIIDIFPYVGDRGVIDLSARGSQWQPMFVGPVTGPSGSTIYYSTSNDPCRTDINFTASGCDAGAVWTTTLPTDITTVHSIKLDLGSIIIQPGDSLEFNWPMRAPIDAPTNGEIAWNSFGYTATRNDNNSVLPSSEPIKVGISVNPIQPAAYGNYIWYDANGNGLQDELAANGINGVKVDLYWAKGATPNIATDSLVSFTITSNNAGNPGYYLFPVLNPGNYYAVFHKPINNLSITIPNVGSDNTINSDGIQTIISGDTLAITAITNLTAGETDYTWDLGLAPNCTKPNAGTDKNTCPNTSVTLTGSPTTGTWSAQTGNSTGATLGTTTAGTATVTFSNTANGAYNFIYTKGSGCTDTMSVNVRATSLSTTNTTLCDINLPYTWNGLTFNTAGTQTVHLTNVAGCDSVATLNLIVVNCSITLTNVCPSMTVNLTTHVDSTGKPLGTIVSYHTGTIATDTNRINNATAVGAGTYYVSYWDNVVGCYSPTSASITVNITGCCPVNPPAITPTTATVCSPATINLFSLAITSTPQTGERLVFSTHNPPSNANDTLTTAQANAVAVTSMYYAFYKNMYCFGPADSVQVTINPKPNAGLDHYIECGSGKTLDTLKAITLNGTWTAMTGNPTGITLGSTFNGVSIISLPSAPATGTWRFIYTLPTGCTDTVAVVIGVSPIPSIVINMGSNPICKNGTVQLCPTPWGWSNYQWYKNGVILAAPTGVSSCITLDSTNVGSYTLAASNGAGCWSAQSAATVVTYDTACTAGSSVTSGGTGGVESKTLGNVIAQRLYGNAINSKVETTAYTSNNKLTHSGVIVNGTNNLTLSDLVPTTVVSTDAAYVSTPTDLVNFTNAVEVLAVDYTKANTTKAVAFATKTLGNVYAHTKPICDRLKGAVLQEVKTINVNGYNLMAYKIQQCTGEVEYAINLSAGTAANRNNISLQSNWFTDSYVQDEQLYNFQLWAVSYDMVTAMAKDIITKLQANAPINQLINGTNSLPKAYVTAGSRKGTDIILNIVNNTNAITAIIELKEKATETGAEVTKQIPVTIKPLNTSTIQLDVKDSYEATINLLINNNKTDMLYLNDGTWALDYNKNNTTISTFNVTNATNVTNDDYRLLRNVNFAATTNDYVTTYKNITTKCNALNLSNYNSLKFNTNATGAASVTITLISSNITNWNEQYTTTINLDGRTNDYAIALNSFHSSKYTASVNGNSVTGVSFAFNTGRAVQTKMAATLSNARFSTASVTSNETNITLDIYPNPNTGRFTASFNSEASQNFVLKVIDIATGRVVKTTFITATKGINKQVIELNNNQASGNYIVTLTGDDVNYTPAKLIVNNKY